jgi:murein DD-endopeptidase MepM/ murein hydrolase activator NlpD
MNKKKLTTLIAASLAVVMALSLLLGLLPGTAMAASSGEIQNQIDKLEAEQGKLQDKIDEIESNLAQNNKEIKNMIARKSGIDQQISALHEQVTLIKQMVTAYNLMIADKQDELDSAERKLALLHEAYKDRIRAMEEQGEISYWSVIFEANSFFEMLDHLNIVAEIARADRQRLDEIRKVAQQVEDARTQLQEHKKGLEVKRRELEDSERTLLARQAEAEGLLLDLLAQGDDYSFELDQSEKLQHDLMDKLAGLEKDKIWAEYLEWLATSVPPTTTTTAPPTTVPPTTIPKPTVKPTTKPAPTTKPTTKPTVNGSTGKEVDGYVWYLPLPKRSYWVSSEFGPRTHPVTGKVNSYHKGIDLAANAGTPIYAVRDGVVRVASYEYGGAGYYVSLGHDGGYSSIYMHMTRYIVKVGQHVKAGDIIGYVGSTGGSTGNHLHLGIAKNGTYVNPRLYFDF